MFGSSTVFMIYKGIELRVTYDFDSLNIHIEGSYKVPDKKSIKGALNMITDSSNLDYRALTEFGFNRTFKSMEREWAAHNVLYRLNYERERTKDVDLNKSETIGRKIGYFILSLFYPVGK